MKEFLLSALLVGLVSSLGFSSDTPVPPNGSLYVTYRQLTEGKLSDSVHHLSLFCFSGECTLTTLTVNQCFDMPGGKIMFPKAQSTDTRNGSLKITRVGNNSLVLREEMDDSTTFTYKFSFSTKPNAALSKTYGTRTNQWFQDLTDFSGGAIKNSAILNKVISWDLVPLRRAWVTIKPNCDMRFQGIPERHG